ncbi:MAG: TonB-dependent receptor [Proteobacteria bacterium]|nr:TonB-dependent receptor [Pseudomonadota bacterium]
MNNARAWIFAAVTGIGLMLSVDAFAQIGPDLKPPGLAEDHPIESFTRDGARRNTQDDWRLANSWELNTSDVVFSASKKRQLISEAPSTIHVITDRDIASHGWRTLAEILRHVPGVQTLTTQSQFQSVMIRGLVGTENNNARILWLQNGVPINDVRDMGIWLDETYPVELIKRIEVVLGPGSALYGSGAFQGVINIFTKDPKDIPAHGEYRLAVQNNLTFKASAIAAYNSEDGNFGILAHVSGNTTQGPGLIGDYVYKDFIMDTAASLVSSQRPPTTYRIERINSNSDKHWYSINFKLNYKQFKMHLGFTDIYAGADGSEIVPNIGYEVNYDPTLSGVVDREEKRPNYRFNRREFYSDLFYEDGFGDSLTFLSLLSYRLIQYRNENYNGLSADNFPHLPLDERFLTYFEGGRERRISLSSLPTGFNDKVNFNTLQHKLHALAQLQWRIIDSNELIVGAVLEYHHINAPEFTTGSPVTLTNTNGEKIVEYLTDGKDARNIGYVTPSIFLQDEQRFWDDRIILTAGGRVDFYKINFDDYSIAPSWRFAALAKWTDWMTMRVSYGYAFKEPSLYQLYVDMFDYLGDTKLKSETLHNVELSMLFTPAYFLTLRADLFATFMSDLIRMDFIETPDRGFVGIPGLYHPVQDSGARILGFEISANANIAKNWNLYTHYNFLHSQRIYENSSDDQDTNIRDDAMHRFRLGATYTSDAFIADLAFFLVSQSPKVKTARPGSDDGYSTPLYAILQPHVTVALPANIGFLVQGSLAFSEKMTASPTYRYYYETEGVPVGRYSVMFSLLYPFKR